MRYAPFLPKGQHLFLKNLIFIKNYFKKHINDLTHKDFLIQYGHYFECP